MRYEVAVAQYRPVDIGLRVRRVPVPAAHRFSMGVWCTCIKNIIRMPFVGETFYYGTVTTVVSPNRTQIRACG